LGKRLVIVGFLLCLAVAVYVYATRETRSLRENMGQQDTTKAPRVELEDFVFYRYDADELTSKASARLGHFFEPNIAELDGDVHGERQRDDGSIETIGAESAIAYFEATKLTSMLTQKTKLQRVELSGFVEATTQGHLLTTDYAEYIDETETVRSRRPVRVEGPNRVFSGDEGFTYSVPEASLTMLGTVKGVLTFDETNRAKP
jgi:LPS export ABC transporter protein LptC